MNDLFPSAAATPSHTRSDFWWWPHALWVIWCCREHSEMPCCHRAYEVWDRCDCKEHKKVVQKRYRRTLNDYHSFSYILVPCHATIPHPPWYPSSGTSSSYPQKRLTSPTQPDSAGLPPACTSRAVSHIWQDLKRRRVRCRVEGVCPTMGLARHESCERILSRSDGSIYTIHLISQIRQTIQTKFRITKNGARVGNRLTFSVGIIWWPPCSVLRSLQYGFSIHWKPSVMSELITAYCRQFKYHHADTQYSIRMECAQRRDLVDSINDIQWT